MGQAREYLALGLKTHAQIFYAAVHEDRLGLRRDVSRDKPRYFEDLDWQRLLLKQNSLGLLLEKQLVRPRRVIYSSDRLILARWIRFNFEASRRLRRVHRYLGPVLLQENVLGKLLLSVLQLAVL